MNKYLEKIAIHIDQYEYKENGQKKLKWIAEGKNVPHGYLKTGKSVYKRKKVQK